MKKLFSKLCIACILSSCLISVILFSCSKNNENNDLFIKQKIEQDMLAQINNLTYVQSVPGASKENYLINENNQFEVAGIIAEKAMLSFLKEIKRNKLNTDSLKNVFILELTSQLPEEYLHIDTTNYIQFEESLKNSMINILIEEYDIYISKSIQIENIIITSDYLNSIQKKRVLAFSSFLRHIMGVAYQISIPSKGLQETNLVDSFGECWMKKAVDLSNCADCTFERFLCKVDFPHCYAIWAADCLLQQL